jgi:hypothetical protein
VQDNAALAEDDDHQEEAKAATGSTTV